MTTPNREHRYPWQPLSLEYLISNFNFSSWKVLLPIVGWTFLIALCVYITGTFTAPEWVAPEVTSPKTRLFFSILPSYIIGLLLLYWVGFEWGFIPLFISSFALAFQSGMSIALSLLFGFSFIFGLALIGLAYQSIIMPYDLRDLKSVAFFVSVIFIAAIASSICALIWSLAHNLSAYTTNLIWQSWWTGIFFQSLIITGPLLFFISPYVEKAKRKYYQIERPEFVSMKWIYTTVLCVTTALLMFIMSGQFLGKYRLNEVVSRLPNISRGEIFGALGSFEIIFWVSIGLILVTSYTAIYLAGRWNRQLHKEVEERTEELEKSRKKLRKSLEEKQLLLKETHHRVKNNLAQVSGLLQLQMMNVNDEKYSQLLQDATSRIQSMSLIHQALYDTEEFENISLKEYLKKLSTTIHKSFRKKGTDVELNFELGDYTIDTRQAVTLGLIVTEVLINAHKYAFDGRRNGEITVLLHKNDTHLLLKIDDDGVGLPENPVQKPSSLGMMLIKKLSQQIDGDLSIDSDSKGTTVSLSFEPKVLESR